MPKKRLGKRFFFTLDKHTQVAIGKSPNCITNGVWSSGTWYMEYFVDGFTQGSVHTSQSVVCKTLNITKEEAKAKFETGPVRPSTRNKVVSYSIDDNGVLTIYLGGCVLATIQDCADMSGAKIKRLVDETVMQLKGK